MVLGDRAQIILNHVDVFLALERGGGFGQQLLCFLRDFGRGQRGVFQDAFLQNGDRHFEIAGFEIFLRGFLRMIPCTILTGLDSFVVF